LYQHQILEIFGILPDSHSKFSLIFLSLPIIFTASSTVTYERRQVPFLVPKAEQQNICLIFLNPSFQ